MDFKQPFRVYTAAGNVEAHLIVEMLVANGIPALAIEDQSGVSLWAMGTISQFHQPDVWIDKSTATQAIELIRQFEEVQRERIRPPASDNEIQAECEECGKLSTFPGSLNGTTQECSHCQAYMDVGELDWDEDFGEPETS